MHFHYEQIDADHMAAKAHIMLVISILSFRSFAVSGDLCIQNKSHRHRSQQIDLLYHLGPAQVPSETVSLNTIDGFPG